MVEKSGWFDFLSTKRVSGSVCIQGNADVWSHVDDGRHYDEQFKSCEDLNIIIIIIKRVSVGHPSADKSSYQEDTYQILFWLHRLTELWYARPPHQTERREEGFKRGNNYYYLRLVGVPKIKIHSWKTLLGLIKYIFINCSSFCLADWLVLPSVCWIYNKTIHSSGFVLSSCFQHESVSTINLFHSKSAALCLHSFHALFTGGRRYEMKHHDLMIAIDWSCVPPCRAAENVLIGLLVYYHKHIFFSFFTTTNSHLRNVWIVHFVILLLFVYFYLVCLQASTDARVQRIVFVVFC